MKLVRWKRFTWQLPKLPPLDHTLPGHFTIRAAARDEAKAVVHVVMTSFSLDSTWSDTLNLFRDRLEMQLDLHQIEIPEGNLSDEDPVASPECRFSLQESSP